MSLSWYGSQTDAAYSIPDVYFILHVYGIYVPYAYGIYPVPYVYGTDWYSHLYDMHMVIPYTHCKYRHIANYTLIVLVPFHRAPFTVVLRRRLKINL